jgi:hypothetical protein
MGPRNAYKDMLDNVVSPITCVSMNHQNQLEQMANGAMFTTKYRYTTQAQLNWSSGLAAHGCPAGLRRSPRHLHV